MEASRQNWIAEQHGATTIGYSLDALPDALMPYGGILALALAEDVSEDAIRAALGDLYEVISIEHAPATHDRYVLARRVTKRVTKKAL